VRALPVVLWAKQSYDDGCAAAILLMLNWGSGVGCSWRRSGRGGPGPAKLRCRSGNARDFNSSLPGLEYCVCCPRWELLFFQTKRAQLRADEEIDSALLIPVDFEYECISMEIVCVHSTESIDCFYL
jgi:hypothetical protein